MDAAEEDQDVRLQRASPELLADLHGSLHPFLWKTARSGEPQIRMRVRVRETDRLVNLLEPFQELPQLLDPHLDKLVPVLADAFIAFLRTPKLKETADPTPLLIPLSRAICRILYTFCKIRGEKVIVRFLSTEMRHIELLLSAVEEGSRIGNDDPALSGGVQCTWVWEERYVALLWLSQLLLAPFDLSTISSAVTCDVSQPTIHGLQLPPNTPGIALRAISLAINHLSLAGKERDAAKVLLARIALRRDMQELGIFHALVEWALAIWEPYSIIGRSAYFCNGILAFVAAILPAAKSGDVKTYLPSIFSRVIQIWSDNPIFKPVQSLAVTRTATIKVLRTISLCALREPDTKGAYDMVEETTGFLIESLIDPATPVRLAASKSLSIIASRMGPDIVTQIIDTLLESLEVTIRWIAKSEGSKKRRDLSRANPFEWHGLILTLSHLLYRHSAPAETLSKIIPALFLGLSFEQRSTTGASIGTNVRDAACFGIWALARRYRTEEIQNAIPEDSVDENPVDFGDRNTPVLQLLATRLLVSATLDPAGNIRRGSSAALQELIGRHPNTIAEGISVVQVVDYHAIALRSNAMQKVAIQAAQLSDYYYEALLHDLLGWRGVQDGDANVRRDAATAIGQIVWGKKISCSDDEEGWNIALSAITSITQQIVSLATREVEELHGLVLSLASIIRTMKPDLSQPRPVTRLAASGLENILSPMLLTICDVLRLLEANFLQYRHPEQIAEAASRLLCSTYPVVRKEPELRLKSHLDGHAMGSNPLTGIYPPGCTMYHSSKLWNSLEALLSNPSLAIGAAPFDMQHTLEHIDNISTSGILCELANDGCFLVTANIVLLECMKFSDKGCVDIVADAAVDYALFYGRQNRKALVDSWIQNGSAAGIGSNYEKNAFLHALFRILPLTIAGGIAPAAGNNAVESTNRVPEIIRQIWAASHDSVDRATVLSCLASSPALPALTSDFFNIIVEGLDDYTTNARGDVGSFVRIEAAKAVRALWRSAEYVSHNADGHCTNILIGKILRLAAEKLDKVRAEGKSALLALLSQSQADLEASSTSSVNYFLFLLNLKPEMLAIRPFTDDWHISLLEGFVTSADTGSEDLVRASRAALVQALTDGEGNDWIPGSLIKAMDSNPGIDRILAPALEVLSFLFDMGLLTQESTKTLYFQTAKAHYRSTNVRKLEAAVKVYGGLLQICNPLTKAKVLQKLTDMLKHPFPRVRNAVAEELWVRYGVGKGVDWGSVRAVHATVSPETGDLVALRGTC